MEHPFLEDEFKIRWSQLRPENVVPDIAEAIRRAENKINVLSGEDFPDSGLTFENTLLALESAYETLSRPWGLVGHLDSVCNSDPLREAQNTMLPKVSEFFAKVPLNAGLWNRIKSYSETEDANSLSSTRRRFLDETITDFLNSGAELSDEKKERLMELESELAQKTQKYSENVLDSTNAWEMVIDEESDLMGLPDLAKSAALESAKSKDLATDDDPKWRFTLQAPSYFPVLEHVELDSVRKRVWEGTCAIGASADYDNTDLVWEILSLRQEKKQIFHLSVVIYRIFLNMPSRLVRQLLG